MYEIGITGLSILFAILFVSAIALLIWALVLKGEIDLAREINKDLKTELKEFYSRPAIIFECDKKKCDICRNPECHHTFDVEYAVNFEKEGDFYVEKIRED